MAYTFEEIIEGRLSEDAIRAFMSVAMSTDPLVAIKINGYKYVEENEEIIQRRPQQAGEVGYNRDAVRYYPVFIACYERAEEDIIDEIKRKAAALGADGWEVALSNKVLTTHGESYILMLDLLDGLTEADVVDEVLHENSRLGFKYSTTGGVLRTGKSFHIYGPVVSYSYEEFLEALGALLSGGEKITDLVDPKWVGHCLRRGEAHLRITAINKEVVPTKVNLTPTTTETHIWRVLPDTWTTIGGGIEAREPNEALEDLREQIRQEFRVEFEAAPAVEHDVGEEPEVPRDEDQVWAALDDLPENEE